MDKDSASIPTNGASIHRPPTRHNIFLSHSGAEKDFVEQLCEDLERANQTPFLDKRPDSLPKGAPFAPFIFSATQECDLAIVVVSQDYFTRTKWPMTELDSIVHNGKTGSSRALILPLFYRLSCKEFKNPRKREGWFQQWARWAEADGRVCVERWKAAVRELDGRNGMEYVKGVGEVAYRKEIVRTVGEMGLKQRANCVTLEGPGDDTDECDLKHDSSATFRFSRCVFGWIRSTFLFLLRQVVISLILFLLLVGYDQHKLITQDIGNAAFLCPCPPSYYDSVANSTPSFYHANNFSSDVFPTCKVEAASGPSNEEQEEHEEGEDGLFVCCYDSVLQQDLSYNFRNNGAAATTVPGAAYYHYPTQNYPCNNEVADKLVDVFFNT